ncbi:hypothetical protein [Hymenobacter coccineus]|uniref:Uncharacterized protein n=1 Tax=Hymenobacter coccineus TaxID=1908235 RepID=A0A1G1SZL6_9BACT|nr:hypothetical protein [Hymenobacter coccineus]OGX84069.1 hypothetical protein BEN49_11700 [Hymenobacter coccineus]
MGFWNLFSGKTITTGDEFFGVMIFIGNPNDPDEGYFECKRHFKPSGQMIELGVTAGLRGPTQRQKDFFSQIETDYFRLVPRWKEIIEQEFGAWMPLPVIQDFAQEFKPEYLSIPTCAVQPIVWEIAFDTVHDLNHIVTVGILDYEPQYVRVDG